MYKKYKEKYQTLRVHPHRRKDKATTTTEIKANRVFFFKTTNELTLRFHDRDVNPQMYHSAQSLNHAENSQSFIPPCFKRSLFFPNCLCQCSGSVSTNNITALTTLQAIFTNTIAPNFYIVVKRRIC